MASDGKMMRAMTNENLNCNVHDACERVVPLWLVLLDNIPTAMLFVLGAMLAGIVSRPLAIFMTLYNLASIVMFWSRICPHCQHFSTRACPCGYGVIAARFFSRKEGNDFRRIFRKNIVIMFPCWFIPFGIGIYLLCTRYSKDILLLFSAFAIVGFILIPAISRFVGCRGCTLKDQCPWMTSNSKQDS
jgi:hypothetical protein